ncbi:DNA polymerase III subunit gamma/tau [Patescibacteria group bacterium]|nr:DNA polymerase III subunit gamma/tau [Patescibacteria group bacterium]MBU1029058.1 DNA polymerase III subunit gamma/tau [Patescibacteria group bacterium]MBU1915659.1 DNA polymerase III subunit gamma/tau [Patescibacteria group bacterium]
MSATLYRKYRPQSWSDIAGQDHVKNTLAYEVLSGQIAHAYLLAGPRGVGKTTTARIFAKAVNCLERPADSGEPCNQCTNCLAVTEGGSLDIIEMDAASHTGVDAVRENIIENARFAPVHLKYKVFIIDEVHMLSTSAFNALLKTLEEPPPNVLFLLATTELQKLPATVISRCQRFDLRKISVNAVIKRLQSISTLEEVSVSERVLAEIARHSEGCLRDAEGLLGKLLAVADNQQISDELALAILPRSDWESSAKFVDALLAGATATALATIGEALDAGADIEQLTDEATEILRQTMLVKLAGGKTDAFKVDLDESRLVRIAGWAKVAELPFLIRALEVLLEKRRELKASHPAQLPLELAAVIICQIGTAGQGDNHSGDMDRRTQEAKDNFLPVQNIKSATVTDDSKLDSVAEKESEPLEVTANEQSSEPSTEEEENTAAAATIEEVRSVWLDCVRKVSKVSQSLSFLLGAVKPVEVIGRKVRLGSGFRFYKDKLNDVRTRTVLEEALSGALGRKIIVEGVSLEKNDAVEHNDVAATEFVTESVRSGLQLVTAESITDADKIAATFGGKIVG